MGNDSGWWQAYAAAYAAVLSTCLGIWEIVKYRRSNRVRLRAYLNPPTPLHEREGRSGSVTIRNDGGIPTQIRSVKPLVRSGHWPAAMAGLMHRLGFMKAQQQGTRPIKPTSCNELLQSNGHVDLYLIIWSDQVEALDRGRLYFEVLHTGCMAQPELVRVARSEVA